MGLATPSEFTGPELVVGGSFLRVGLDEDLSPDAVGISAQNVAMLNLASGRWRDLGGGFEAGSHVKAIAVFDDRTGDGPAVFVGTDSTLVWHGQLTGPRIARWSRAGWTWLDAATANVGGAVLAMEVLTFPGDEQPSLHVAGFFSQASDHFGSHSADQVARWLVPGDSDDDLVPDACDNCPALNNPDQDDDDRDGIGDDCDSCVAGDNGLDLDEDGVPNGCDNCVDVANMDQLDTNEDGVGDACAMVPSGLRLVRIEDRAGRTLEVFEYLGDQLARCCRGTSCLAGEFDLLTTYEYHADGRLDTFGIFRRTDPRAHESRTSYTTRTIRLG